LPRFKQSPGSLLPIMARLQKFVALLAIVRLLPPCSSEISSNLPVTFEAPLCPSSPDWELVIPQEYIVVLALGNTLEQHLDFVGEPLTRHIEWWFEQIRTYSAKNVTDELLARIRADPAVELVEFNQRWNPSITGASPQPDGRKKVAC
jgi:hypothetical protein